MAPKDESVIVYDKNQKVTVAASTALIKEHRGQNTTNIALGHTPVHDGTTTHHAATFTRRLEDGLQPSGESESALRYGVTILPNLDSNSNTMGGCNSRSNSRKKLRSCRNGGFNDSSGVSVGPQPPPYSVSVSSTRGDNTTYTSPQTIPMEVVPSNQSNIPQPNLTILKRKQHGRSDYSSVTFKQRRVTPLQQAPSRVTTDTDDMSIQAQLPNNSSSKTPPTQLTTQTYKSTPHFPPDLSTNSRPTNISDEGEVGMEVQEECEDKNTYNTDIRTHSFRFSSGTDKSTEASNLKSGHPQLTGFIDGSTDDVENEEEDEEGEDKESTQKKNQVYLSAANEEWHGKVINEDELGEHNKLLANRGACSMQGYHSPPNDIANIKVRRSPIGDNDEEIDSIQLNILHGADEEDINKFFERDTGGTWLRKQSSNLPSDYHKFTKGGVYKDDMSCHRDISSDIKEALVYEQAEEEKGRDESNSLHDKESNGRLHHLSDELNRLIQEKNIYEEGCVPLRHISSQGSGLQYKTKDRRYVEDGEDWEEGNKSDLFLDYS